MSEEIKPGKASTAARKSRKKTLVFVRHAQSAENVKVIRFFEGLTRLRNFEFPTWQQIISTLSLLSLTIDSLVSQAGKRQILDMHMILRDNKFWKRQNFDLILCSPLTRARETCEGILPCERENMDVLIQDDLEEATPFEHAFSGTLLMRIEKFKLWLADRDEERILIVGHSQYFKKMLGLTTLMRNCDVWQCDFASDIGSRSSDKTTFEWTNLNLLHRTELSDIHPYDKMVKSTKGYTACPQDGEEVYNDLRDDEPVCRICQTTQSEDPSLTLIKPCQCSGSAAYVHIICLNKWRETSRAAHKKCSVCNYRYQVIKPDFAKHFLDETNILICTSIILSVLIVLIGVVLFNVLPFIVDDGSGLLLNLMQVSPIWRQYKLNAEEQSDLRAAITDAVWHWQLHNFPYHLLICNDTFSDIFDVLFLGFATVGGVGIVWPIINEISVLVWNARGAGAAVVNNPVILWYAAVILTNGVFVWRLGLLIGCHYVFMKIYIAIQVKGRNMSNVVEQILEYNST